MAKLTFQAMKLEHFRKIVKTKRHKAIIKYVESDETVLERDMVW